MPRRKGGVVLNYDDAVLYESDMTLYRPPEWLNDACIHFGFKYIGKDTAEVLLMDPAVYSFMILQCQDDEDFDGLKEALKLEGRRLILIPINDAANFEVINRGTHWSLLGYRPFDDTFEHYDSMPSSNHSWIAAPIAADKFKRTLLGEYTDAKTWLPLPKIAIPEQTNGYDCGAHVLAVAHTLATNLDAPDREKLLEVVTPDFVRTFRQNIFNMAQSLSEAFLAKPSSPPAPVVVDDGGEEGHGEMKIDVPPPPPPLDGGDDNDPLDPADVADAAAAADAAEAAIQYELKTLLRMYRQKFPDSEAFK